MYALSFLVVYTMRLLRCRLGQREMSTLRRELYAITRPWSSFTLSIDGCVHCTCVLGTGIEMYKTQVYVLYDSLKKRVHRKRSVLWQYITVYCFNHSFCIYESLYFFTDLLVQWYLTCGPSTEYFMWSQITHRVYMKKYNISKRTIISLMQLITFTYTYLCETSY